MSSTVEPESCEMVVQSSSQATALLSTQKLWWIKSATLGGGDEGKEKALDTKRSWTIGVRDKGSSVDEEYRIDLIWYRTHNVVRIFVDGSQAIEKPREFGHDGEVIPFSCAVACGTHQVWITSADIMGMIYQIEVLDATRKRDRNSAFGVSGWRKAALTERRTDMQRPTAARSYPRSAVVTRIDKASSSNSPRDLCQNAWSIVVTRDDMSTLKSEVHMTWNKYSDIMRITVDKVQTFHGTRSSQPEFEVMVGEFYGKIIRKSDDEFDMAMLEDPVKTFGPGQQVMISSDDASLEPLYALTSRPPMPQVMVIESARPVGKFNKPSKLRYVWRVQLSQTDGDRNNQRVVLTWTKSSSLIRIFVNAEEVWAGGLDSNGLLNAFVMLGECKAQIFSTATDSENFQLRIIPKVDSSKSMSTVQSESPTMRLESPIATRLQTADPKCMARSTLPLLALHADVSSPVPSACAPTESTADPNNPLLEGSNAPTSVAPTSPVDTLISAGRHSSTGSPAVVRGMEFARLGARGQPENDPFHQQQQPDDVFEHDSTEDKSDDAYQDSAAAAGAFTDRAPIKVRKSAESSSTPPPIEERLSWIVCTGCGDRWYRVDDILSSFSSLKELPKKCLQRDRFVGPCCDEDESQPNSVGKITPPPLRPGDFVQFQHNENGTEKKEKSRKSSNAGGNAQARATSSGSLPSPRREPSRDGSLPAPSSLTQPLHDPGDISPERNGEVARRHSRSSHEEDEYERNESTSPRPSIRGNEEEIVTYARFPSARSGSQKSTTSEERRTVPTAAAATPHDHIAATPPSSFHVKGRRDDKEGIPPPPTRDISQNSSVNNIVDAFGRQKSFASSAHDSLDSQYIMSASSAPSLISDRGGSEHSKLRTSDGGAILGKVVEEPSGVSAAELSMRISSAKKENFPDTGTSQSVSQPLSIPFEADPRIPLAVHSSAALMVRSESAKVGIGKYLKKTKLKYLWRIVTQDGDTTHRITLTWSKRSQKVRIWNGSQLVSEQLRKTETEFCTEFSIAGSTVKVLARKGTDEFILDAGPSNCVKRGMDDTTSFSASACASPTMSQASSYIAESTHTGKSGELQPGAKVTPTCETQIHREFSKIGVGQFQRNSKLKYGWRLQIEDEEEGMLECLLVLTWSRSSGRVRVMIEDRILIDRSWDPKLSRFAATIPFGDRAIIVNSTIDDDFHVDVVKKSDFPFLQMSKGIEEDEETVSNPFLSTFLPDDRFYHEE